MNSAAIEKILSAPRVTGKGERHVHIRADIAQLVANGMEPNAAAAAMREKYPDADKPDSDFTRSAQGAAKLGYKPWSMPAGRGYSRREEKASTVKPYFHDGSKETLPETEIQMPFSSYFRDVLGFTEDEYISFAVMQEVDFGARDGAPYFLQWRKGKLISDLLDSANGPSWDSFSGEGFSKHGTYFAVNPLKTDSERKSENVSRYLYAMFESDKISKEEQLAIYHKSGLPIVSLVDSGGASVHALVRVDASNLGEFNERARVAKEFLGPNFDTTQDPVRFTRLPNAQRGENRQRLLEINVNLKSWDEWEAGVIDDGLPPTQDLAEFIEIEIVEPAHLLQGFWRIGQVISVCGAMKTNKSWTMMECAQALPVGGRFMKWEANMAKVFYIDTELEPWDYQFRHKNISAQTKHRIENGDFRFKLLRTYDFSIDELAPKILREIRGKGYSTVFLDSIYSLLGDREENSNEDIASLGKALLWLAGQAGVGIAFSHHFSKGSQFGKRGIEKSSGAGAWGRFVDAGLAIDHHTKEGCYNIEPEYRTFAWQPPFVARRVNGIWSVENDLKVERKNSTAADVTDLLDVLVNEGSGECSPAELVELCATKLAWTKKQTDNRKRKAIELGLMEQIGRTKKTVCKLKAGVEKDSRKGAYQLAGATCNDEQKSVEEPF